MPDLVPNEFKEDLANAVTRLIQYDRDVTRDLSDAITAMGDGAAWTGSPAADAFQIELVAMRDRARQGLDACIAELRSRHAGQPDEVVWYPRGSVR